MQPLARFTRPEKKVVVKFPAAPQERLLKTSRVDLTSPGPIRARSPQIEQTNPDLLVAWGVLLEHTPRAHMSSPHSPPPHPPPPARPLAAQSGKPLIKGTEIESLRVAHVGGAEIRFLPLLWGRSDRQKLSASRHPPARSSSLPTPNSSLLQPRGRVFLSKKGNTKLSLDDHLFHLLVKKERICC